MTQTIPREAPAAVTTALPAAHNVVFHAADDTDIEQARSYLLAELVRVGRAARTIEVGGRCRHQAAEPQVRMASSGW